jgi:hypothetical protein
LSYKWQPRMTYPIPTKGKVRGRRVYLSYLPRQASAFRY